MVDSSFYGIKIPNARLDQQILNPPSASDQMVLFNFQHGVTFQVPGEINHKNCLQPYFTTAQQTQEQTRGLKGVILHLFIKNGN